MAQRTTMTAEAAGPGPLGSGHQGVAPARMGLHLGALLLAVVVWTSCDSSDSGNRQADGEETKGEPGDARREDEPRMDLAWEMVGFDGDGNFGTYQMEGTWAEWEVGASVTQAPLIGETRTLGVALMRWVVTQTGEDLSIRQELCHLRLVSDQPLANTVVPDLFIKSVPLMEKTGRVTLEGTDHHFIMDLTPELYGVALDSPLDELLPTTADDPRVIDQDGDGHPGMTVFITGVLDGAAYIVQRNLRSLDGVFVTPDRIEGLMDWTQDQSVLGSDNQILASTPATSVTDPDPTKSRFVAIRIPADKDCAWLRAHEEELFPQP